MNVYPKTPVAARPHPRPPRATLPSRRAVKQWLYGLGMLFALILGGALLLFFSKPTVIVITNVSGATVYLNGEPRGATNQLNRFSIPSVPPGRHVIRLTHPEYLDAEQAVTVEYGFRPTKINIPLRSALFTLTVQTEPMTTVRLDGVQVGETDLQTGVLAVPRVRVGGHQISLQRAGYLPVATAFDMPEGDYRLTLPLYLDLNGYWKGVVQDPAAGKPTDFILSLGQTGTALSGLWEEPPTTSTKPPRAFPVTGRLLDNQRLTLERKNEAGRVLTFEAQVSTTGRDLVGVWRDGQRTGAWSGSRTETKPSFTPVTAALPAPPITLEPGPRLTNPPPLSSPAGVSPPDIPPAEASVVSPLARAQALYEQRRYDEALAQCDAILKQDPKNTAARHLKRRIQTSLEILKSPPDAAKPATP
ncbi:MAG: PEGA domain-containing protein [Chloracidobacterium sp.]|nr:PEGA domain-containing protein [Chloracidobacterium sp.]MDW8216963.1 PEGA domain-containing protein [Acidobacteriota bacterium]